MKSKKHKFGFLIVIILLVLISGCSQNESYDQAIVNGDQSFSQGDYPHALQHYKRAIELNPDANQIHRYISTTLKGEQNAKNYLESINNELVSNQNDNNWSLFLLSEKYSILRYLMPILPLDARSPDMNETLDAYLKIDPNDLSGNLNDCGIEPPTSILTSTPIPTTKPTPKYYAGDIVNRKRITNTYDAIIILGYDPNTDEYATNSIFRIDTMKSWETGTMDTEWYGWSRTVIEELYPYKLDHVGLTKLKQSDGTPYPVVSPPYPEYNSNNDKGLPKSGYYIRVDYADSWSGTITTLKSSRSVDGKFQEDFLVDKYGSGCFSKQDGSHNMLSAEVIQNGEIVRSEYTTNPYGIVCVSV